MFYVGADHRGGGTERGRCEPKADDPRLPRLSALAGRLSTGRWLKPLGIANEKPRREAAQRGFVAQVRLLKCARPSIAKSPNDL